MKRFRINSPMFVLDGSLTSTYCWVEAESMEHVIDKMRRDGFYLIGTKAIPWPPASIEEITPAKES